MTTVFRADYQAPAYLVDDTSLVFELNPDRTLVTSTLKLRQNPHAAERNTTLTLDGEHLELLSLSLDGQPLAKSAYTLDAKTLSIAHFPQQAALTIKTAICPASNSELTGLYVSNDTFFTQCEAEGFRRITFFPDRPDVMSRYTVEIHAEQSRFPVLLSNGNLLSSGPSAHRRGWHFAQWADPHPKPSYLFALVAGKLVPTESHHTTPSGRTSLLQVWVAPGDEDKTAHAMACLKQAIEWDETRFNLELDLDRFMIVASHDFNMGAMENKGLNIFNARYVLANPSIATDDDYAHIESIVAHEYF
ncbi:MAG TPA: M1 family aminopeptidase, partial [Burkholderiaceae bacterium]|nr:M1 family aminopeptidase [Burkholderiaceae bacterium]